ncbi:hypothetical protein GCM10027085_19630 [Spirosoma aerophilum]
MLAIVLDDYSVYEPGQDEAMKDPFHDGYIRLVSQKALKEAANIDGVLNKLNTALENCPEQS